MHHHGYLWTGPKERFDTEALRRPPHPEPPPPPGPEDPAAERLFRRYRDVASEFPLVDLPPLETAYWLVKPRSLIRGSWDEATDAAVWLGERLAEFAPRFANGWERDSGRLAALVDSAVERLRSGGDVSVGAYLEHPSFLSLAVVTCSPNLGLRHLPCPAAPGAAQASGTPQVV
ncbi:hypothetical protein GCM10010300_07230 [Streptomyces olivaceoviridis]|uniref:hypothetical protein n=1 Tax=Streptomyces olivaceoviridis TaxID=1921 RepID=UPI0016796D00|nr:hypothetical protein [Streptomyces olivaceoviridis]GGY66464.1 hypothetical protein GCM10010300_07230 [Streptomyces olivaceoviridis]